MQKNRLPFQVSLLASAILLSACGSDSKSKHTPVTPLPSGFIDISVGTSTISAIGGASAGQEGGEGGEVSIYKAYSEAPLNILTSGTPDTAYELPETTVQLGAVAVIIDEDTTIQTLTELPADAVTGLLYFVENEYRLFRYDGSGKFATNETQVTGLQITVGATLTLETNNSSGAQIYFANDIQNDGKLVTSIAEDAESANHTRNYIRLYPAAYSGSGEIVTSGAYPGQDGGDIRITAFTISNSGTFNAQGADDLSPEGGEGGEGGSIRLYGQVFVENNGDLNNSGGDSINDTAGRSEYVRLSSDSVFNSGNITAEAGTGKNTNQTDQYHSISLYADNVLINSGNLSVDGSDANADGYGGQAGSIYLSIEDDGSSQSEGRRLINTGDLAANGGNTISSLSQHRAGNGGDIQVNAYDGMSGATTHTTESSVMISGNMSSNGGNSTQAYSAAVLEGESEVEAAKSGSNAGDAGQIRISHQSNISHNLPTYVLGYQEFNTSGGEGVIAGRGGNVNIYTMAGGEGGEGVPQPAAPLTVETQITSNGGHAIESDSPTTKRAGNGGHVGIYIDSGFAYLQPEVLNLNVSGNLSSNAGNTIDGQAAYAGGIYLNAPNNINITADLSAIGSSDIATSDDDNSYNEGGEGGWVEFYSQQGNISYQGSIIVDGGDGIRGGGDAGSVYSGAQGSNVIAGSVSLAGGNATIDSNDELVTEGGHAGTVIVRSGDQLAELTATVTATGGNGDEAGIAGGAFVNSDCQQGTCNSSDRPR